MAISGLQPRLERTTAPDRSGGQAPPGLSVRRETVGGDPVTNIVVTVPRYRRWLSGAVVGAPAVLTVLSLGDSDSWFIGLFCLAFVLSALLVFVPDWRTKREIDITKAYITFSDTVRGSGGSSQTIATRSVRAVDVVGARRNLGKELRIAAEDETLRFGAGLSGEALVWLRNQLTAAVRNA